MKTALYIRVSTDAQYEEGYSVDAQKERLRGYCEYNGIKDYEFYIDGGWSGSNINRPEVQRLITDIQTHTVDKVIVFKLDRLSRSQKDTLYLIEDVFTPNGCSFISLNENFDTSTPFGKAMIGILSVFAQLERENIRERTRMGMKERVKEGLWMGGGRIPFGYDYDPKKDILIPNKHAKDVKQIYELYLQGYSTTKLATMFDVASDKHITSILDRITYLGKIKYNDTVYDGQHEAIISQELYDKVQRERQRRTTKNAVTSSYLFTSLIYCGKCGAMMRYQKWGKNGLKVYCKSQQKSRPETVIDPNCDNIKADADELEKAILQDLFIHTQNCKSNDKSSVKQTSALEIMQQKYTQIQAKLKNLYRLYANDDNEALLDVIDETKKELNNISIQIGKEKKVSLSSLDYDDNINTVSTLEGKWDSMTIQEKQRAIRICIRRIEINDLQVKIMYNF